MSKIVVIGSSNVDFIMKMDHLPRLGETVTNASYMQTYGGKGANQAVGAARAGGDVWFVNCVGDDTFGPLLIENMQQLGVHMDYVYQMEGVATGAALVMIDANADNYLSVAPGANYRLTPAMLDDLAWLVDEAALVILQCEVLPETLTRAIELGADRPIIFNLAPARHVEDYLFQHIDYLVVNEIEAEFLVGFPVTDPAPAADALLQKGVGAAIITLGSQGVYVATEAIGEHVPAFPVQAVDTTAAGDVFCGALGVALVEGKALPDAVRFANAASAICVTRLGAQPSAPSRDEIDTLLAAP